MSFWLSLPPSLHLAFLRTQQSYFILIFLVLFTILPKSTLAQGTDFFDFSEPEIIEETKPVPPPPTAIKPLQPEKPAPPPQAAPQKVPEPISISDVIFLFDVSGSMNAPAKKGQSQNKIKAAQEALSYFARKMKTGTRFQLWSFNQNIMQHSNSPAVDPKPTQVIFEPIGSTGSVARQHLLKIIEKLQAEGGTNLYEAIYRALQYFASDTYQPPIEHQTRYKVIVVLADGQDDGNSRVQLPQVLQLKSTQPEIEVKTIGFGIENNPAFQKILCQLASQNTCTKTSSSEELQKIIHSFTRS